jgi:hypothetical protein
MMVDILRLFGVFAILSTATFAYSSAEEDEARDRCLQMKSEQEKKSCMVQFEKKFYPESVYNDEELHWSDIDWSYHS